MADSGIIKPSPKGGELLSARKPSVKRWLFGIKNHYRHMSNMVERIPRGIQITIKFKYLIILGVLGLALWPHQGRVIAEGGVSTSQGLKMAQKLPTTKLKPLKEASVIVVSSPAPSSLSPNCGSDPNLAFIYEHESGCCPTKWQGEVGGCRAYHGVPDSPYVGYGLCQSTPASKMASAGSDWESSWATQNSWCRNYAIERYGSTAAAYQHWLAYHNW